MRLLYNIFRVTFFTIVFCIFAYIFFVVVTFVGDYLVQFIEHLSVTFNLKPELIAAAFAVFFFIILPIAITITEDEDTDWGDKD